MKPTPKRQPDCRLSNLVLEGGRSKCYRPKEHQGDCGEPIDQAEDEARMPYDARGPFPDFTGTISVKDSGHS